MLTEAQVRQWSLSFEEATESPHFEKSSFRVKKKIFCTLDTHKNTAVLKLTEADQSVFSAYDSTTVYPVKGAWGKKGWTIFLLDKTHPDLFKDALTTSYCNVAPKKLAEKYSQSNAS